MKWAHLPLPGGLYDQHPALLDQWRYIFAKRNEHEAEEERKRKREQEQAQRQAGKGRTPRGASRSR